MIFLNGGMSQFESWDPKPGRTMGGPFQAMQTSIPGYHVSELMPKMAMQLNRHTAVIRSIETGNTGHEDVTLYARTKVVAGLKMPGVIDHYIDAKLKTAGVSPAPQADDTTLVRRLTLDLAGRIPTAAQAQQVVASNDPQKRRQRIDRLVASPWFDRHTATEFNTVLRGGDGTGPDLRKYLLVAFQENRPWYRMFRELLGDGSAPLGAEQFIVKRVGDADQLTRDMSAMFFGVNVTCCQCHTPPY